MKKGRSILLGLTAALLAAPVGAQTYYRADADLGELPGFGRTLAAVGGHLLVGEPNNQIRPGTVYVYGRTGGSWNQTAVLRAGEGGSGDRFGTQIASSGDHLFISSSMGVHHFHRQGDSWGEMGMVTASDAMGDDAFGTSIAMSGDYALIGAPGANEGAGAAYLFHFGSGGWQQVAKVMAEGGAAGDAFGMNVAIDGSTAVVAAPMRNNRQGTLYAYEVGMSGLTAKGTIEADDLSNNARLGTGLWVGDVSELGRQVIIASAPSHEQGRGTVRVFAEVEGEYVEGVRLGAFDPMMRSNFGGAMAYTGGAFLIGASAANGTGVVYRFEVGPNGIESSEKLVADGVEGRASFGSSIVIGDGFWAVGAASFDSDGGVAIYDMNGNVTLLAGESEGYESITGNSDDVRCNGGAAAEWECSEVDLVSFLSVEDLAVDGTRGLRTNDNWGWTDPETGKEWALVGLTDRLSFVDMSDPYNPVVVGVLPMTEGARASSWRDVKTYMNHAYIVSDGAGQHGMQVFDLTRLRDFDGTPQVFDEDFVYTNIASAHNIVINEESGFAYSVGSSSGGETCGGGLHMIDIRDPKNPTFAGCFADPETGRASTGYSHDAQCVNYVGPDSDYAGREICIGSNETAISLADVTDKDAPVAISRAAYPNPGYTHQGWLTPDHRFLFVNDELDELSGIVDRTRTIVWDLTDLDDPQLVVEHLGTQESSDHNLYIQGNLMYQSNYQSGLRILDVSDPANPTEVAYFDTVPYGDNGAGFGGSWSNYPYFESGVVLVTSGSEGMFLVRPTVRRTVF